MKPDYLKAAGQALCGGTAICPDCEEKALKVLQVIVPWVLHDVDAAIREHRDSMSSASSVQWNGAIATARSAVRTLG